MILLIDNYDSFSYNLYQYLEELGREVAVYRNDALGLDTIRTLKPKAIVISPGPGNPDQAGISLDVIREFGGEIPILGVCLGVVILKEADLLAGDIRFFECGLNGTTRSIEG